MATTVMAEKTVDFEQRWKQVQARVKLQFGKTPDLDSLLFLIGIRELGVGQRKFSKEEKQDLMHIAVCRLLSSHGYFELEGYDEDGWPHWKPVRKLDFDNKASQEQLLKTCIIEYFENL